MTRGRIIAAVAALVAVVAIGALVISANTVAYRVKLVMDSAAQLAVGSPVWVDGVQVGRVDDLSVVDGKAVATLGMDGDAAPLHAGTESRVEWLSALGERVLTLTPGPETNPVIPDGGSIEARTLQIEVDQVLATLDEPTRIKLSGMLRELNATVDGQDQDLRETLQTAGPSVNAVGEVMKGVGTDGPALRALVTQLAEMSRVAAERQDQVRGVVTDLSDFTREGAAREQELSAALEELPPTLVTARETLDRVPGVAEETVPLLDDLRPAVERLPEVSRNLAPVLTDLRGVTADLRPTLEALNGLLDRTPPLLDKAHDVVPPVTQAVDSLGPALEFLRPYAPEAAGFLTNFGTAFAPFDSQGQYWAGLLAPGSNAFNESLFAPPGSKTYDEVLPGQIVDEAWTDAHGSGIR